MITAPLDPGYVELLAKQLPPSGATLRLIDIGGKTGTGLLERRADIEIVAQQFFPEMAENSVDAVLFFEALGKDLLVQSLRVLRPGARLIGIDPAGQVDEQTVKRLESAGYTRILVESVGSHGVLLRGEKPHETGDTLARIDQVAGQEAVRPDLSIFKGRYVHLLVRQTPNKPVWAMNPDETIQWHAVGVNHADQIAVLAFSSLPNAVAFMQRAVLAGAIKDVNKVGKFTRDAAGVWPFALIINPIFGEMVDTTYGEIEIDPGTAMTGEE